MERRFISIWFRHLLTDWLSIQRPELKTVPFILVTPERGRIVITAANALAEKHGITVGMAAADAKAIIPSLQIIDDTPGQAARLLKSAGEWCIRFAPLVAIDLPDGLLLDVSGCAHLWGGEQPYLKEIITRLTAKGYDVRGAMASTPGTVWAMARFGRIKAIIAPGEQAEALMPLSPVALRLDALILERLQKLGFYTIKSFMGLARPALRRRFGQDFLLRIDQALGTEDEPLQWLNPAEPWHERLPCLEPIKTAIGIELAIKTLLENLCKRLLSEGKGLRTAVLKCYRVDGKLEQAFIGTNRPTCHSGHLFKLFELKISSIEPDLGIELFTIDASKVEDVSLDQEALWESEGCDLEDTGLAELLDRLANKIGADNIHRYLPQEHYWPERSVKKAVSLRDKRTAEWRSDRPRPSLLLRQPENIRVIALNPDYPPKMFIYKGITHHIEKHDGPERIEREWWLEGGPYRDYYTVEDKEGKRYWVFRSGDYENDGKWFIHGFFA